MQAQPEEQSAPHGAPRKPGRAWILIGLALVGVLILSGLLGLPRAAAPTPALPAARTGTPVPTDPAPMSAAPSIGPKDAPVTIIEYADFGCPSCWYWYKIGVLDQLRTVYGDKIRFVWRDFPVITLRSPRAAEAGQCANEQGRFWQFHDAVYQNEGVIDAGSLETYARASGLDMARFDQCVTSRRYQDRVNQEQLEGFDQGFHGTPFFVVNGRLVLGPQNLAYFVSVIDPLLAAKQ